MARVRSPGGEREYEVVAVEFVEEPAGGEAGAEG